MNQSTPMNFIPDTGVAYINPIRMARSFRLDYPKRKFNFNPWTGEKRHERDIQSDPSGLLIIPPGEPLYAAPPKMVELEPGLVKDLIDYGLSGKVAEPYMVEKLQAALLRL